MSMPPIFDNIGRSVSSYQDFLDIRLGSDCVRVIESGHASNFLEAVEYLERNDYATASTIFLSAAKTALTPLGIQCCETLSSVLDEASHVFERALANAASESRARDIARNKISRCTGELYSYLLFLGICLFERKEYMESAECFNKVIQNIPNHSYAYFCRGTTKIELYEFEEAINDLKSAMKLFAQEKNWKYYRKTKKILLDLEKTKSSFISMVKKYHECQFRQNRNSVEFGSYDNLLKNVSQLKVFLLQITQEFPEISPEIQREMAAKIFFDSLRTQYDNQHKKYTDLDREFMKAICLQYGLDLQQYFLRNRSLKGFTFGLIIGICLSYIISLFF